MNSKTYEARNPMKPVLGAFAVAASVATLALAVVAPAAMSKAQGPVAQVASAASPRATEVAIQPATIEVVGKRAKVARADSPYLPASYRAR